MFSYSGFQKALWWWLLTAVAALFGAMFVDRKYYLGLNKPKYAPPPWLFAAVWPVLYALQAQAAYFVQRENESFSWEVWMYVLFLSVSTTWTVLFFGLKATKLSMIFIVSSTVLSFVVTVIFGVAYTASGLMMAPTIVWLLFASWLNWQILTLNPTDTLQNECKRANPCSDKPEGYDQVRIEDDEDVIDGDGDGDSLFSKVI